MIRHYKLFQNRTKIKGLELADPWWYNRAPLKMVTRVALAYKLHIMLCNMQYIYNGTSTFVCITIPIECLSGHLFTVMEM